MQACHSVESDEEFAFGLQQQEFALLNDSGFARNLQVILWLCSCYYLATLAVNNQTLQDILLLFADQLSDTDNT